MPCLRSSNESKSATKSQNLTRLGVPGVVITANECGEYTLGNSKSTARHQFKESARHAFVTGYPVRIISVADTHPTIARDPQKTHAVAPGPPL